MKRFFSKNKIFFLSYLFIFILSFPTYSTLLNINPTFSNVSQHSIERKSDTIWEYKTVNGKKYKRLYDTSTKKWLTDWILV